MKQYSKRMVWTHWLTLALLVVAWFLGDALDGAREADNATLVAYIIHALIGAVILLLTLIRLYFRRKDGTPAPIGTGTMDKVATGVHHLLYTSLILLPISGAITIFTSPVGSALLAGDASLLPKKYTGIWAHDVHGALVNLLILIVVVHVLGAIKHQFILKDGLMSRMSLRKKD
jgi:cytochrome b561